MEEFNRSLKNTIHFLNSFLSKEYISENEMKDTLSSVKELCVYWRKKENYYSEEISIRISNLFQKADKKVVVKVPFWVALSSNLFGYMAQEKNQTDQFKEEIKEIRNEISNIEFLSKWES